MASYINRGESVFFQFRNGKSVLNSQCKPRMFKTAEKATLGVNYIETDDVVEYAEVKRGRWEFGELDIMGTTVKCSCCGWGLRNVDPVLWTDYPAHKFCGNCGADMREV